ncbi:hypothetical protein NPX13_g1333 [Xylaria arbuscula]|uniref:Uncharacterized protein n=1 Tax=Xylaria arbuscula TaxID=114810 RepID=A0A9W8TPR4_9PEZI|nr:hypothetical protein NPX13_g1333 [Xylaria arbuscula]
MYPNPRLPPVRSRADLQGSAHFPTLEADDHRPSSQTKLTDSSKHGEHHRNRRVLLTQISPPTVELDCAHRIAIKRIVRRLRIRSDIPNRTTAAASLDSSIVAHGAPISTVLDVIKDLQWKTVHYTTTPVAPSLVQRHGFARERPPLRHPQVRPTVAE